MVVPKGNAGDLEKRARHLQSSACLVKDAAKHDELQQRAQELLAQAAKLSGLTS
jgi:hypothetical protein